MRHRYDSSRNDEWRKFSKIWLIGVQGTTPRYLAKSISKRLSGEPRTKLSPKSRAECRTKPWTQLITKSYPVCGSCLEAMARLTISKSSVLQWNGGNWIGGSYWSPRWPVHPRQSQSLCCIFPILWRYLVIYHWLFMRRPRTTSTWEIRSSRFQKIQL